MDIDRVAAAWGDLSSALGFDPLDLTEATAHRMSILLDALVEQSMLRGVSAQSRALFESVANWVEGYERAFVLIEASDPVDLLQHLMAANGLKQKDLAVELGGQPAVSAILNRKRTINARQARALGRRFGLSAAVFIGDDDAAEGSPPLVLHDVGNQSTQASGSSGAVKIDRNSYLAVGYGSTTTKRIQCGH